MSSGDKALRSAQPRLAKAKFNTDTLGENKRHVIEKIDVASLEIDESFDVDCDPYNNTGQFLANAWKTKYDE